LNNLVRRAVVFGSSAEITAAELAKYSLPARPRMESI